MSDDAAGRIASLLLSLACGIGTVCPDGVEIRVGNEDLAAGANVTPFTVSRTLSEWQREGILTKGRSKLLLRRPEFLMSEWQRESVLTKEQGKLLLRRPEFLINSK